MRLGTCVGVIWARVLAGGPGGWVGEVGEGKGQVQLDAVALFTRVNEQDFDAAQWCQPNMSSRAYRGGGVLVPSEAEGISQDYAWHRTLVGLTASGPRAGGAPGPHWPGRR